MPVTQTVSPTGIATAGAFGSPTVKPSNRIAPQTIFEEFIPEDEWSDTDDGSPLVPIDIGFDFEWGSSGVKRLWFPTTDGSLIAADADLDLPFIEYEYPLRWFTDDPDSLYGVAVTGADHLLASARHGYWYPGYEGIRYATFGAAPNRVFVCIFDLPFYSGNPTDQQHVTAQVQMREDGTIEVHYKTFAIDPGNEISDFSIGIWWRDSTDTDRYLHGEIDGNTYDDSWPSGPIPDFQAVRYTPSGDTWSQAPCTYDWIDVGSDLVGFPKILQTDPVAPITGGVEGTDAGGYGGPVTIPNIGLLPDRRAEPGFFRIKLTTLHRPGVAGGEHRIPAHTIAYLSDFSNAKLELPLNDQATGSVTISLDDPVRPLIKPYKTLVHYVYVTPNASYLLHWGIVTKPVFSSSGDSITLPSVDHSLRLQHHYVRLGDRILNGADDPDLPNPYNAAGRKHGFGKIPEDAIGIRYLIEAAQNTDAQDLRGVPPLGIRLGSDPTTHLPTDTRYFNTIKRGAECWSSIKDVLDAGEHDTYPGAPDMELTPYDGEFGIYALLNFWTLRGDPENKTRLHDGFGLDNAQIDYSPGGTLNTHVHVLSKNDVKRVTEADLASSLEYGVYVKWLEQASLSAGMEEALRAVGHQWIEAYGDPPDYFSATINEDADLYFKDDFDLGDTISVAIRREGEPGTNDVVFSGKGDVVKVTLSQADQSGNVTAALDIQPPVADTTTNESA